jgi:hypothetical protein
MNSEITLLKQITDPSFKQKVLLKLTNVSGCVISLRDKFGRSLPLKIMKMDPMGKFYCKAAVELDLDFSYSETYTGHFSIDNEKYMFEAFPTIENHHVVVVMKRMYHMQNRQTMRYKVPDHVDMKLIIGSRNQEACILDCTVNDLNSLGCSITLPKPEQLPERNDIIDATLIVNHSESLQLQAIIKNVREVNNGHISLGLEFHHLLYAGEERLNSIIAELHGKTHLKSS